MDKWASKHEVYQRDTSEGLKWVARTRDKRTGQAWLFRFAWDERPPADVVANLDNGREDRGDGGMLDRTLNYVRDRPETLQVWRPTTRKRDWLIRQP